MSENLFKKEWHISFLTKLQNTLASFGLAEKIVFAILFIAFSVSALFLVKKATEVFLVEIPASGGGLIEGEVGSVGMINPLLAISDADRDLTAVIYSGLLKSTPLGALVGDLAKDWVVSEDGLQYTFTLKNDIFFHDGAPLTVDDVLFTIQKAQDPSLKSPKRANWEGVTAEKIGVNQIKFTLKQPYSSFLENATLGILPKHLWKDIDSEQFSFSQYNVVPIGSGPFEVSAVKKNSGGLPTAYELKSFKKYALGRPLLNKLTFKFFNSEETLLAAFNKGEIESMSAIAPTTAETLKMSNIRVEQTPLPRIFALFFNQNQVAIFANLEVRKALALTVDRSKIVDEVLGGYGTEIFGPLPPGILPETVTQDNSVATNTVAIAESLLIKNGWKKNNEGIFEKKSKKETLTLAFTITTSSAPELKKTAEILKANWTKIGANVSVIVFDPGELNQTIIRPRKYDALLFGEIIGRDPDLFAFWHSSQRNDPGLNIALYTNIKADKFLEEVRTIADQNERLQKYMAFSEEIKKDVPAIFLYSPDFMYVLPKKIKSFVFGRLTTPSDRFAAIHQWYTETDKIWSVFKP
ncbi:MAG TPA: peptide ABC transporter substrate-binding protein [Candidatus Paceibacterota bacterium]